jgi:MFS family permease
MSNNRNHVEVKPELSTRDLPALFQRFWLAAAVSNLGDGIRLAALPLLALELTDDARLISGVTAMSFVPWIAVGPLAGALVDRHDRRTLMLIGQVARGIAVLLLAIAISAGWANIALLFVVALIIGAGETVVDSASQAAIPRLVDDHQLERANGQLTVAENLFNDVLGVALGAVLFSAASSIPFYTDAATFILGAVILIGIRKPLQGQRLASRNSIRADIGEGLRFLARHRFLRGLAFSVAMTNLALNLGLGVMVILVVKEIGASTAVYGTILAVGAAGGVAGSMVAGRLTERLTPRRTLMLTHIPFVAASMIYMLATEAWMVSAAFALSSFALVIYQIPSRALRQRLTPEPILGRVVAAFRIVGLGGPVVGAPLGGVITEAFGVRWAFAASTALMVVAWMLVLNALRHHDTDSTQPQLALAPQPAA